MKRIVTAAALLALLLAPACTRHRVDMSHDIKPIHITMDINLKIDTDLDQYFGAVDAATAEAAPQDTQPSEDAQ